MPFIKICGIRTYGEGRMALDCGATALGFLVGLTHLAEDEISADEARDIVRRLPRDITTVLVTHLLQPGAIADMARFLATKAIQVHGDVPAEGVARLAQLVPDHKLIKAVHVTGSEAIPRAIEYAHVAQALLLDSRTATRLGGTGLTHDWAISRQIVAAVTPVPVYLAGGLNPTNVRQAIEEVRPAGVDVNSGVEDDRGQKDKTRLYDFLSAARAALDAKR